MTAVTGESQGAVVVLGKNFHHGILVVVGDVIAVGGIGLKNNVSYPIDFLETSVMIVAAEYRQNLLAPLKNRPNCSGVTDGMLKIVNNQ